MIRSLILLLAVGSINGPASGNLQVAERGEQIQINPPPHEDLLGLQGKPYAPVGLSDCDEMNFYRVQWGLPDRFSDQPRVPNSSFANQGLGWRESNCRNEDNVRTYCCYGYWQLYPSLHLRDHRMQPKLAECEVNSYRDINSDTPQDKQRQACYAKALYDTVGLSAWAL